MSSQSREQGVPEIRILTAAPNPSPNALKIQEHFVRAFNGDREGIREIFVDDFKVDEPLSLPFGGVHSGYDGFQKMTEQIREYFAGAACPGGMTLYDAGDVVIAEMTFVYTSAQSDRELSVPYLERFRFDGDRVSEARPYPHDSAAMVEFLKEEAENSG